jgi:hypothetical protein
VVLEDHCEVLVRQLILGLARVNSALGEYALLLPSNSSSPSDSAGSKLAKLLETLQLGSTVAAGEVGAPRVLATG